jgi:hypothetical protein
MRSALIAVGLAVAIASLASLSPMRFDAKALGAEWPRGETGPLPQGRSIVYVSSDDSAPNGHVAAYGLDLATFPSGQSTWVVFSEGFTAGPWSPSLLLNRSGGFLAKGFDRAWHPVDGLPEPVRKALGDGVVLVRSRSTLEQVAMRWPGLDLARVRILASDRPPLFEMPRWRVGLRAFWRLLVVSFIATSGMLTAWRASPAPRSWRALRLALALPCLLAGHTALTLILGEVTHHGIPLALGMEALLGALALTLVPAQPGGRQTGEGGGWWRLGEWPVALAVGALWLVAVLRLDFDGDLFTHWLPMARSYYLLGHHDIAALAGRYGVAHQATYPPGFPVIIATVLWVSGMDAQASLQPGNATHVAVFLYRLVLATVELSVLTAVGILFWKRANAIAGGALPVVAVSLLLPLFLGRPSAAEAYLVPMMAAAIVAFAAGECSDEPFMRAAGVLLATGGLLVKGEGGLIVLLLVLPWYLLTGPRNGGRRSAIWQAAGAVGGVTAFAAWRIQLARSGIRQNFMFDDFDFHRLATSLPLLARLAGNAGHILLNNNFWLPLVALVPAALLPRKSAPYRWRSLLIPLGIALYVPAVVVIYVFSRSDPIYHMNTSYERLVMVAVFSACLYGTRSLLRARPEPTPGAG